MYQLWTDISESRQANERLKSLQRAYSLLTGAIEAALQHSEAESLYQAVCELAVSEGQYQLAWVGLVDEATGNIVPVARAGLDRGYVDQVCATISTAVPEGRGPSGQVMRDGQSVIVGDIASDSSMGPWRDRALSHGFHSMIALPIHSGNQVIGVFMMYANSSYHFDMDERELLIQLSNDLSISTESVCEKERRKEAEQRLRQIAFIDELTGLPKISYLRESIAGNENNLLHNACCLIVQLERFSEFNHVLGHDYGDQILSTMAKKTERVGWQSILYCTCCRRQVSDPIN